MCTLWPDLRYEMPIVLRIHNDVHHHLLIYVHIILKLENFIAVQILRRSLHWLALLHHHVWFVVISVWLEHSASLVSAFTVQWKMESVHCSTLSPSDNLCMKLVQ
jgi:hypothetical protein